MRCCSESASERRNVRASSTVISLTSAMDLPPTVTARLSGRRRLPQQSGQGMLDIYASYSCFMPSDCVSRYRRSRLLQMPSNGESNVPLPNSFLYSMCRRSLPVPYKIACFAACGSSANGVSSEKPYFSASAVKYIPAMDSLFALCQPLTEIAPFASERLSSGTTSAGSIFIIVPRPEHVGHAPNGLLKENMRGVSSSRLTPQSGQA